MGIVAFLPPILSRNNAAKTPAPAIPSPNAENPRMNPTAPQSAAVNRISPKAKNSAFKKMEKPLCRRKQIKNAAKLDKRQVCTLFCLYEIQKPAIKTLYLAERAFAGRADRARLRGTLTTFLKRFFTNQFKR